MEIVCIEGSWLNQPELKTSTCSRLRAANKLIGLGCLRSNKYQVEKSIQLQDFLGMMIGRLGQGPDLGW